jgi:plasmid maintenance system killer protein
LKIGFKSGKLEKECNNFGALRKQQGEQRAKVIRKRLDALRAAVMLEDLRNTPGRLHELAGDRKGQLSFDLDGPYRLIFTPSHNPVPLRPSGGMDWSQITAVTILGIEDTHG